MESPLVSIILTLYNGEQFVRQAIESVLSQTFQNWELVIVNDASVDRSMEIVKSFHDDRIRVLYLECNMGAAGDMLTAALLELTEDRQAFIDRMNALRLPGVRVCAEPAVKCGITGTHMKVTVNGVEEEAGDDHHHDHDHDHDHDHHHDHSHEDHDHHHDHEDDHHHEHHHASMADIDALIDSLAVSEQVKARE